MPTNPKQSIPTLLAEWGQMTPRERDAEVAQVCMGWKRWKIEYDGEKPSVMIERPDAVWMLAPRYKGHISATSDPVTHIECPAYTSEDSPRSLSKGVKAKVIEKVGIYRYKVALWNAMDEPHAPYGEIDWDALFLATAEQEMCACWIAERMAAQGGEG